ncbi:hypothetical protein [Belliella pelovolcani]|uniref:hypothetical protein n=1 Tax=Belliella pelovolcani TaxID=529505 RepID=UPI00391934AC
MVKLLLPHQYQKLGYFLIIPSVVLFIACSYFQYEIAWLTLSNVREKGLFISAHENFTNELAIIGTFLSLFLIAFSKEQVEDEYILKLRLESILIALYTYSIIFIIGTLVFYNFEYLNFVAFNFCSIKVFYIIRFRWLMYKQNQQLVLI